MSTVYYNEIRNSKLFNQYLKLFDKVKQLDTETFIQKIGDKGIEASDGEVSLFLKKDSEVKDFIMEGSTQDHYKTICIWLSDTIKSVKPLFWDLVSTFIIHECVHIERHSRNNEDQNTNALSDNDYLKDERELNAFAIQSIYANELGVFDFADEQYSDFGDDTLYDLFLSWVSELED